MLKEHDPVVLIDKRGAVLIDDLRGDGLRIDDFGYIVSVHAGGAAFTVEFFDQGETAAVAAVRADQVRPATEQDVAARRIPA